MTDLSVQIERLSPERRELLMRRLHALNRPPQVAIERVVREEGSDHPLSFAQERLWFLEQLSISPAAFNIPSVIPLPFAVDREVLRRSLDEIVRRHEALRTRFVAREGLPRQRIAPELKLPLDFVDLSALGEPQSSAEAARLAQAEAERPFDLAQGPLIRCTLLRRAFADHLLLLTFHHIVADGWSIGVLLRELGELYRAYATGAASPLPELAVQYVDFAVWQRAWLSGAMLANHLDYWRGRLRDVPPLDLPLDHPRPAMQTYRGDQVPLEVSPRTVAALRSLSQQHGCTLFMTMLAAFYVLLFRYTGQKHLVVGSYIANRNRREVEAMIGFFVNTLALRIDVDGDPTFSELLLRVRECAVGAYAHQDLPFPKLIEELHPERDLSRNPVFQVVFHLFNAPTLTMSGQDATGGTAAERQVSVFDLVAQFFETSDGVVGGFEYNTDLFLRSTIERMAGHYRVLLEGIAADAQRRVSALPLLPPAEREEVLHRWNATDAPFDFSAGVADLFRAEAARRGDAIALIARDEALGYDALARRVATLAGRLVHRGVLPGARVGVSLPRSFDAVAALLAIWSCGGVYVPLDPGYPEERLRFMASDADLQAVITRSDVVLALAHPNTLHVDAPEEEDATSAQPHHPVPVPPDATAYVIYTSGSTGRPKGVAVPHRQVLNRLHWMWQCYPFQPADVGCQRTALNFVDALWEQLGPLLRGVPSVILSDEETRDLATLVQAVAKHRVTHLWVVPSVLGAMLDMFPDLGQRLPDLRFWVSSGEALTRMLYDRFCVAHPRATLYNLYGTSEVWDATWLDPGSASFARHLVPIGAPISNVRAYVLDGGGFEPAPVGVRGELCIAGLGLADGYLHDAGPADRFVSCPWNPGERMYRTGDLARWLPDGTLEYLGRADRLLKVRGYRVEPAEVEAALLRQPDLQQAVVTGRQDRLVAYVVSRPGASPQADDLRRRLRSVLPEFMVPLSIILLERLPLTPNGKIDQRALVEIGDACPRREITPPRTAAEKELQSIFAEVLARPAPQIGVHDHFFNELGGHSLLATRLVSRVGAAFRVELAVRSVFEQPTIASLAERLAALSETGAGGTAPAPIPRLDRQRYTLRPSAR